MAKQHHLAAALLLLMLCVVTVNAGRNRGSTRGSNSNNRAADGIKCPRLCQCSRLRHTEGVFTNCSRAGLAIAPVTQMDPDTVHLDLTHNGIQRIRTDTFMALGKLETLLLSDNHIHNLEVNAFYGLNKMRTLDLRRNQLQVLRPNVLGRVSGHPVHCASNSTCVIDLRENDLEVIETNALAWIERLSVLIGGGARPLTLKSYAFYGIQDIQTISISDVPSLILERHAITNAERVGSVQIMNTRLADIQNFTFQGLEGVGSIVFHNAELSQIKTLGLGAVRYNSEATTVTTSVLSRNTTVLRGGVFNMSYCQVAKLDSDIFRDTNLAHIVLTGNRIYEIAPHAFRGLADLQTLHMAGNSISSLPSSSLGGLSGLKELVLDRNQMDVIEAGAFRGSQDIDLFRLSLQLGSNLTLGSYAFADVLEVSEFQLVGNSPLEGTSFTKTTLAISQDAFHDFVADKITIENVSLPTLRLNAFRGLSKVKNLTFVSCDVQEVESGAFGPSYGGVHTMMIQESQLPCDCQTHRLVWEFRRTFARFHVPCWTAARAATPDAPAVPAKSLPMEDVDWAFCLRGHGATLHRGIISTIIAFTFTLLLL